MNPSRGRRLRILQLLPLGALLAGICHASEGPGTYDLGADFLTEDDAPRGRITIGYQTLHTEGLLDQNGVNNRGAITDTHSLTLAVDYRLSDRWTAHVAIPFVRKRSRNDPGGHNPARLTVPHPDSRFLDDGRYHSAWQDWTLGLSYHTQLGAYHVAPRVELVVPSHDYTFFANAAVGQRLERLRLGVDVTRRLGQSNFHATGGYSYELVEKVLGIHLNKHHLRLALGYHFSPQLSGRVFVQARRGQGRDIAAFAGDRTSEFWYQHDRLSRHEYTIAGLGATWRLNDDWAVSASAFTMVWGRTVHELEYAGSVEVSRGF